MEVERENKRQGEDHVRAKLKKKKKEVKKKIQFVPHALYVPLLSIFPVTQSVSSLLLSKLKNIEKENRNKK